MTHVPPNRRRIYELILEMAGGSPRELIELLTRLRDERPALYRTFVAQASCAGQIHARSDERGQNFRSPPLPRRGAS
jgi:hypothetical protein